MSAFRNRTRSRLVSPRRTAARTAVLGVLIGAAALAVTAGGPAPAARPGHSVAGNISWDSVPAGAVTAADADPAPAPTTPPATAPTSGPGNISWDSVPANTV